MELDITVDDRRDALRQRSTVDTLWVESHGQGMHLCSVLDISRKGMRIRMPICLPCGAEMLIHPPIDAALRPARARIVRQHVVEIDGETWIECGIQFTEEAELRRHTWFLTLRAG